MHHQYENPELTPMGEASEIVMGTGMGGDDFPNQIAWDFEFEND